MKKILSFLLGAVLAVSNVFADDVPYRQQRRDHFSVLPVNSENIVFLGNSITNFGVWPEMFGADGKVLNRGISGNFSQEVLNHFDQIITGKPKAICLMIGINDNSAPAVIVPAVEKMLKIAQTVSPSTKIYVQSILPSTVNGRASVPTTINPQLETLCGTYANAEYVDIYTAMNTAGVSNTMDDNLHPKWKGYQIWAPIIAGKLNRQVSLNTTKTYTNVTNKYYCDRILGQYALLPVSNDDVLMVGDYLVQQGEWAELFCQNGKVKNRGIGLAMTPSICLQTSELNVAVGQILHDGATPSKIFIQCGGSDACNKSRSAQDMAENIKTAVNTIKSKSPSTEIYLQSIMPVRDAAINTSHVVPANNLLKAFADQTAGVTYVNLYNKFVDSTTGAVASRYQNSNWTGKGLNARFYIEWAAALQPYMGSAFKVLTLDNANYGKIKYSTNAERHYYNLTANKRTENNAGRFVTSKGETEGLMGELDTRSSDQQWMFVRRTLGDYDIINRKTGCYIDPSSAANNTQLKTSKTQPGSGWTISATSTDGMYIITSGSVQLHQTAGGLSWKIYNWGGGTNASDTGCTFHIEEVAYSVDEVADKVFHEDEIVNLDLDHAPFSNMLPQPKSVVLTGMNFAKNRAVNVTSGVTGWTSMVVVDEFLAEANLTKSASATAQIVINKVSEIKGAFDHQLADFANEAYQLIIANDHITINAVTEMGVIRAMQTLRQLAESEAQLPGCEVVDWPAFKVRGYMHDIGRSFIDVQELKKEIDLLSRFKVNVFHWHITDKQAFRFESKLQPKVNTNFNSTRWPGKIYSQAECKELMRYAKEHGMTIIPEIDMPGHSDQFTRAMGFTMASEQGRAALKQILSELVQTFDECPYIHIGGDETKDATEAYINEMADYVRSLGKKVVIWNNYGYPSKKVDATLIHCDMTTNWATSGTLSPGVPNIDMRYNYMNHFDVYADLAGIYRSNIFYVSQGNPDVAGSISGMWCDRVLPKQEDIIMQNNFYANVLATVERAWMGGGKQYIETGGAYLPNSGEEYDEFCDWERRFLHYKSTWLKNEPIPYVKQTNVRWNITSSFANGGDVTRSFAEVENLEDLSTLAGTPVTGAGIWLAHIWNGTIQGALSKSEGKNQTRYAWTYVYSPKDQTVGTQIEFRNYSRSEVCRAPNNGTWSWYQSKVWVNGEEKLPNFQWQNAGKNTGEEDYLYNENFTARDPYMITLKKGWNKVLLKLPYADVNGITAYKNKWQFTFVFTDPEGKNAVEGLRYSPNRCADAEAERVATKMNEAGILIQSNCGDEIGAFPLSIAENLQTVINQIAPTLEETLDATIRDNQISQLDEAMEDFRTALLSAPVNQPDPSKVYTVMSKRGNRYATSTGVGNPIKGLTEITKNEESKSYWYFTERGDGLLNIVNYADNGMIKGDGVSSGNQMSTSASQPATGWGLAPSSAKGWMIIKGGTNQFNQQNNGQFYVLNWGGGTNTTDEGCQYKIVEVDGITTEIVGISQKETTDQSAIYDLCGRRCATLRKGVSIMNGKVVIF